MTGRQDQAAHAARRGTAEFRPRDLLPALLLAGLGFAGLSVAALSVADTSGQFLVVSAPWHDRGDLMALIWRAEGGVAGFGGLPSVAIAMSDRPDFAQALRDQGAWIVLPSPRFVGCSARPKEIQK